MLISDVPPDIMLITEVIPKKTSNPIAIALLDIEGYNCHLNFDPNTNNLVQSGIRGVAIYSYKSIMVNKIGFLIEGQHDHIWVEIPTEKDEKVLCGCLYRSPSNDIDLASCKTSTDSIRQLITKAYE